MHEKNMIELFCVTHCNIKSIQNMYKFGIQYIALTDHCILLYDNIINNKVE